jgi:hypothetical protein
MGEWSFGHNNSIGIVRIGCLAQAQGRFIPLLQPYQIFCQARRPA